MWSKVQVVSCDVTRFQELHLLPLYWLVVKFHLYSKGKPHTSTFAQWVWVICSS